MHLCVDNTLRKLYNELVFLISHIRQRGGEIVFNKVEFEVAMLRKGVKRQELARILGIDVSTLYRKLENNGDFDREQISRIMAYLDIDDPNPIFFAKDLT